VCAPIVLSDNFEGFHIDKGGFGRRGTTVDAEHVFGIGIVSSPTRWRVVHQITGLRQRFERLENQRRAGTHRIALRHQSALTPGKMRCTKGFEVRRFIG